MRTSDPHGRRMEIRGRPGGRAGRIRYAMLSGIGVSCRRNLLPRAGTDRSSKKNSSGKMVKEPDPLNAPYRLTERQRFFESAIYRKFHSRPAFLVTFEKEGRFLYKMQQAGWRLEQQACFWKRENSEKYGDRLRKS